jgi:hypothetical protein
MSHHCQHCDQTFDTRQLYQEHHATEHQQRVFVWNGEEVVIIERDAHGFPCPCGAVLKSPSTTHAHVKQRCTYFVAENRVVIDEGSFLVQTPILDKYFLVVNILYHLVICTLCHHAVNEKETYNHAKTHRAHLEDKLAVLKEIQRIFDDNPNRKYISLLFM